MRRRWRCSSRCATSAGVDAELIDITASSVGRGLHYLSETRAADLLVVGSSAQGLVGRVLVGDITRAALIGAPCAVAVAPMGHASAAAPLAKIGVGYDGTPESEEALALARELAALHGAAVSAMTVVEPSAVAGLLRTADEADYAEEIDDARPRWPSWMASRVRSCWVGPARSSRASASTSIC